VLPKSRGKSVTYVLGALGVISHNVPHVCDAAPRLTEPRGRCGAAERRGARGAFRGADAHTRCYATLRHILLTNPYPITIRFDMPNTLLIHLKVSGILVV
jgi:hypothetical protein